MSPYIVVESDNQRALTIRLKASGYDVITAEDGLFAVSKARNEHPDLVLLDIGLPCGDGLSVLERYRKLPDLHSIPVVVLTGRDPAVTETAVRRYHVAGFLRKPVDNDILLSTIFDALADPPDEGSFEQYYR